MRYKIISRLVCGVVISLAPVTIGRAQSPSAPNDAELSHGAVGKVVTLSLSPKIEMRFCYCPAGRFRMGSLASEFGPRPYRSNGDLDELIAIQPPNETSCEVEIRSPFWLAQTECTQAQWTALMGKNPSKVHGENLPIDNVTWNDAKQFALKVNSLSKLPAHWSAGLPSEAQWEYACRAGSTVAYGGLALTDIAWYAKNSGDKVHLVGTKRANAWGLFDMLGNVFEFCDDWYGDLVTGGIDPKEPAKGEARVYRGCAYGSRTSTCREAVRHHLPPDLAYPGLGFRLVLEYMPQT